MNTTAPPTVVIVPGLRDHVPHHWQTLLADRLDDARLLPPLQTGRMNRDTQVAALERTLARIPGPVVLVAHSAGVLTTVHWARQHHHTIRGALLAAPPDFASPLGEGHPSPDVLSENGWTPVPMKPLPFPSIVAASTDDPLAAYDRVAEMADAWGSRLVNVGPVGHLNPASGYGEWSRAEQFLRELS